MTCFLCDAPLSICTCTIAEYDAWDRENREGAAALFGGSQGTLGAGPAISTSTEIVPAYELPF